jgi:FkbH-like protein
MVNGLGRFHGYAGLADPRAPGEYPSTGASLYDEHRIMMLSESISEEDLLSRRRSLRRRLVFAEGLRPVRIAVLGGSTTNEVVELLEILLLASGFLPTFHQSGYGKYYEESVIDPSGLSAFAPDLVYIHTSYLNVQAIPPVNCSEAVFKDLVNAEVARYRRIWKAIEESTPAQIVQNNFELPSTAVLGNRDGVLSGGGTRYYMDLNAAFAEQSSRDPRILLQDNHRLSAELGLRHWFDWARYFNYKILLTPEANIALARSLASIIRAIYGKSRKVLVLDLDNTLWGGVIGEDGVDRIQIGRETAVAEAYTAFQEYCLSLHRRGVLLAVCSKNDEQIAKSGFEHPDSILKLEHVSCFKANWEPKHENILAMAKELNLGVESFVFLDDNPAERALVRSQIPGIAVPELGDEISAYVSILEQGRYFEPTSLSREDLSRPSMYEANAQRATLEAQFANYGEYLDSLAMTAEIEPFTPVYLERIAQLTNKTNQFNLTGRRYTLSEMESILRDKSYIGIYGRLSDRFGDHGVISVVLGRIERDELHIDLWLMSCRVLKRDMEFAMLDVLVEHAQSAGLRTLRGNYVPTNKNGVVKDHYERLGFEAVRNGSETKASAWKLDVAAHRPSNRHIGLAKRSLAFEISGGTEALVK